MKRRSLCEEVSGTGCVTSLYRLLLDSFKVSEKYRAVVSSYNVAGGQLNVDHVPSPEVKKVFLFDKTSANNIIRGKENKFKW